MERMDTHIFWNVIGEYNSQTIIIQIGLFIFLILVLFNHSIFSAIFLFIFVMGLVLMSKISYKFYLRGILSYVPFLILLFF